MTEPEECTSKTMKRRGEVKASRYKTSLCQFYQASLLTPPPPPPLQEDIKKNDQGIANKTVGRCPFGDRCAFAHGLSELRTEEENIRQYQLQQLLLEANLPKEEMGQEEHRPVAEPENCTANSTNEVFLASQPHAGSETLTAGTENEVPTTTMPPVPPPSPPSLDQQQPVVVVRVRNNPYRR